MILNIIDPIPTAAKCTLESPPIRIVSTVDKSGTDILLMIFGMESRSISIFIFFVIAANITLLSTVNNRLTSKNNFGRYLLENYLYLKYKNYV